MPTYEYECTVCGHIVDVSHGMNAKPRVKCPECGSRTKKNIGAGAGIIFKGSGFYETDYKRKSAPKESKPEGADAAKSAESKPAETKKQDTKSDTSKAD